MPHYVGIWQKPVLRAVPYEAHFGITLKECMNLDVKFVARQFVATQFRVFNKNDNEVFFNTFDESFKFRFCAQQFGNMFQKVNILSKLETIYIKCIKNIWKIDKCYHDKYLIFLIVIKRFNMSFFGVICIHIVIQLRLIYGLIKRKF